MELWKLSLGELGVNDVQKTVSIQVYPNPVQAELKVQTSNKEIVNQLSIYGLDGKLIKTYNPKSNNPAIDVSQLPKGTYLIEVQTPKGKTNKKFIKN